MGRLFSGVWWASFAREFLAVFTPLFKSAKAAIPTVVTILAITLAVTATALQLWLALRPPGGGPGVEWGIRMTVVITLVLGAVVALWAGGIAWARAVRARIVLGDMLEFDATTGCLFLPVSCVGKGEIRPSVKVVELRDAGGDLIAPERVRGIRVSWAPGKGPGERGTIREESGKIDLLVAVTNHVGRFILAPDQPGRFDHYPDTSRLGSYTQLTLLIRAEEPQCKSVERVYCIQRGPGGTYRPCQPPPAPSTKP